MTLATASTLNYGLRQDVSTNNTFKKKIIKRKKAVKPVVRIEGTIANCSREVSKGARKRCWRVSEGDFTRGRWKWLVSGRVIPGSFWSRPAGGTLAKTSSHLDLCLHLLLPTADQHLCLRWPPPPTHLYPSISPLHPPHPCPSIRCPPPSLILTFSSSLLLIPFPPTTLSINPSHRLRAPRREQQVSGITPSRRGVAGIRVRKWKTSTHTHTDTESQRQKHQPPICTHTT